MYWLFGKLIIALDNVTWLINWIPSPHNDDVICRQVSLPFVRLNNFPASYGRALHLTLCWFAVSCKRSCWLLLRLVHDEAISQRPSGSLPRLSIVKALRHMVRLVMNLFLFSSQLKNVFPLSFLTFLFWSPYIFSFDINRRTVRGSMPNAYDTRVVVRWWNIFSGTASFIKLFLSSY